jgi:hypothetical protein
MMNIETIRSGTRNEILYRITISERESKIDVHSVAELIVTVEHYFRGNHYTKEKGCPLCEMKGRK